MLIIIMFGSFLPSLGRQSTTVYSGRGSRHCYEIMWTISPAFRGSAYAKIVFTIQWGRDVNKTPHARDSQGAVLGNSERPRLPRAQLVLMFTLVALFSFPAAFVGTALTVFAEPQTVRWYAIFVSPGWFAF